MSRLAHVRITGHVPDYEGKQLLQGLELEVSLETARGWINLGKAEMISAPEISKAKMIAAPDTVKGKRASAARS